MSLTAELFGSSTLSSSSPQEKEPQQEQKQEEDKVSTAPSISFEPTKKAAFDLFALAPQVKKASRKEKQRLRAQNNFTSKEESSQKGKNSTGTEDNKKDIFATVFINDEEATGGLKGADKKKGKPQKHLRHALQENDEEESRTVFVGNLVNDIKRRTVEKVFKNCGVIECVRIRAQALEEEEGIMKKKKKDLEDGVVHKNKRHEPKSVGRAIRVLRGDIKKGDQYSAVAYVLFKDKSSVPLALERNGIIVHNRHIVVTAMDPESRAYPPETSIFIGNIAYDINEEAVWNFFVEKGIADVRRVRLVRERETGVCKGFGYVEFHSRASVARALGVRGALLRGREIRIVHVQKSKDVTAATASRREKRRREEVTPSTGRRNNNNSSSAGKRNNNNNNNNNMRDDGGKRKRVRTEGGNASENRSEHPAWMGVVTNPRKKIPKDLRPIVEGKKMRAITGPRAPVKRKMRNPEK